MFWSTDIKANVLLTNIPLKLIGLENEWKGKEYLMNEFEENKLRHVMEQEMQQGIAHVTIDQGIVMILDQLMEILVQDMIKGKVLRNI